MEGERRAATPQPGLQVLTVHEAREEISRRPTRDASGASRPAVEDSVPAEERESSRTPVVGESRAGGCVVGVVMGGASLSRTETSAKEGHTDCFFTSPTRESDKARQSRHILTL